jgi:hypothetical protein
MNANRSSKRSALIRVAAFALLHYLVLLLIGGAIFLASHFPPKAVNLDPLILALFNAEFILTAPRKFLLWLWPGETTPGLLSIVTVILNSLLWGAALAGLRWLWVRARS